MSGRMRKISLDGQRFAPLIAEALPFVADMRLESATGYYQQSTIKYVIARYTSGCQVRLNFDRHGRISSWSARYAMKSQVKRG